MPAVQPAIRLDRLSKRYGDRLVVDAMSVEVAPGELFGFLGPNGAGKTTSIKMLVGLVRPTLGRALLCGYDVVEEPMRAKAITGYCPDQPALYDKLSGREMLRLSADLYSVSRRLQSVRIEPLLETFALAEHADELIQSYSRGMKQKLSLCAALLHDPRVLLLDEPTVGLDPAGARQLRDVLRRLCDDGRTVFLSTHSLGVAEALCDRVGIVQNGRLLVAGTPAQLRSRADTSLEDTFLRLTGNQSGDEDTAPLLRALRS